MAVLTLDGQVLEGASEETAGTLRKEEAPERPVVGARTSPQNVKLGIVRQLYVALEKLGADPELLSIIESWYDTLNDAEILTLLRLYHSTGLW
jgi:hypothetical protein